MPGSAEIRVLRRRIRSVKSTQKITRAMELIAAARIARAQQRVYEALPYATTIHEVIKGLAVGRETGQHPLLNRRENERVTAIAVITGDRGLAGAYNANVLRHAERLIAREEADGHEVVLYLVGRKGHAYFRFRGRTSQRTWTGVTDTPTGAVAAEIADELAEAFTSEAVDKVILAYTDYKSSLVQVPAHTQLLPVEGERFGGGSEAIPAELDFEPDPESILELLIPRYVEARVYAAMLESSASEHASRQRAMKAATDNAQEVVENLSRVMNQARQDQITTEISEIVGGAEAMAAGR